MNAPTGPRALQNVVRFLLTALARNWRRLPLPLAVGAALTTAAAYTLSRQSWESSGVMIYSPLPVPEPQKGLFPQPDLPTLVTLVRSPSVLAALREEYNLSLPLPVLEKAFKVTSQRNTQTVTVSLQWAEPEMAARLTNRLMEKFIDLIRTYRRQKAAGNLADYEARLEVCDAQHASAAAAYREHFRKHHLFDAKDDLETLRREIDSLLYARSLAARSEPVVRAKRERVAKDLAELRRKDAEEAEQAQKFDAAQDSVSDARRRQDRLRELIEDDRERQKLMVELTAKRKEYERRQTLFKLGSESRAVMDTLAAEIDVLTTRLTDTEQVKKWKGELEKIDQVVVPNSKGPRQGSPIVTQTLQKQLDLDLELIGVEKQLFEIDRELSASRHRQEELRALLTEADALQNEMAARVAERQQLTEQVVLFRRLRDQEAGEFSVISAATPGPYPVSSTRKLILIAGLVATLGLSLGRVCWRAWADQYHGGRALSARLKLPTLGVLDPAADSDRRLVTELRRWRPAYGAALVWVSDGNGHASLDRIVSRLAMRDERVLVVDCRVGAARPPADQLGLGDLLTFRAADWAGLLQPGPVPGVEVLPAGGPADPDLLDTHLMRQTTAEAVRRYSVVLFVAPALNDPQAVASLVAQADGVIVCLGPDTPSREQANGLRAVFEQHPEGFRAVQVERAQ